MDLVIATKNAHKTRELRALLRGLPRFDFYSLSNFPDYVPPEETGTSFEEQAIQKATHAAKTLNRWVIADDSGLVVPALKGAPGIFSARYAGEDKSDVKNRRKLLKEMEGLEGEGRSAYFVCCIALSSPDGLTKCVKGICEGEIVLEERGGNGFGYDPLFRKYDYNQTFGELDETVKNQISHRAKALEKLRILLESL